MEVSDFTLNEYGMSFIKVVFIKEASSQTQSQDYDDLWDQFPCHHRAVRAETWQVDLGMESPRTGLMCVLSAQYFYMNTS